MLEGIVDIGSNSVRMTVYDCDVQTNEFRPFFKLKNQLGLASHIDPQSGKLDEGGVDALISTLKEYRRAASRFTELDRLSCFATAAIRNSSNCQEVLDKVDELCGVQVELLSGVEEARLGFVGAMWHSGATSGVQIDVGGGSSEVLIFEDGQAKDATSVPMGSLSLFEKYVDGLLPTAREAKDIREAISKRVRKALGSDIGIGITGWAGPDGDDVGLVFVALASRGGCFVRRLQCGHAPRPRIRLIAASNALDMIRRYLTGLDV